MSYKSKILLEMPREKGRDLFKAVKATGKFVKDAFLTELVPRELKSKLKNYDPSYSYIKVVRPSLKFWGTVIGGTASLFLGKNPDLPAAALRAQPVYIYGFVDFGYDLADFKGSESYLPPATLLIEGGYKAFSYFSNLLKKQKLKINV
jgi:hypothetical protein